MPAAQPTGVTDTASGTGITDVDVILRASPELTTTITADPGSGGTSLTLTAGNKLGADASGFYVRIEDEIMLVTAGGTGTTPTVTRAQLNTTAVAHAIGSTVWRLVGVQRVEPVDGSRITLGKFRANTFRIPGRAGTTGQKILSIHNATGSPVKVRVNKMWVDLVATVVKAVTVLPPAIRMHKVTVLPTNGTALTKVPMDSVNTSNSSVTVLGDASADGTNSATALTATLPGNVVTQEFAPRLITAAGYEMFDRETFLDSDLDYVTLNALEGIVLFLDYVLATQNPTTDMWIAGVEWEEYRVA